MTQRTDCDDRWIIKKIFPTERVMHHLHIDQNAPCLHPQILHNHWFQFLLGNAVTLGEIEDNAYAKFLVVNKVHYGLCENGEWRLPFSIHFPVIVELADET